MNELNIKGKTAKKIVNIIHNKVEVGRIADNLLTEILTAAKTFFRNLTT